MNEKKHIDVLVLGAGAAGVAAAFAAAGKGMSVALIEKNSYLGGMATAAEVGTICGLYKFSKTQPADYIVKGFAKEFAEQLRLRSHTEALSNPDGLHYLPYDIQAFKDLCVNLLNERDVDIYLHTSLEKVDISDDVIKTVFIKKDDDVIEFAVKSIIACSGNSIISELANLPFLKDEHYQAAAQVFTLENVAEENEARLSMILMKALRQAIDEKKLPVHFDRVYIVPGSLKQRKVNLKLGIPVAVTYETGNLKAISDSAKDFIEKLSNFLFNHVAAFKDAFIQHVAPEPGIRVGSRIEGKYILTEEDVLSCRKFNDAIANCSWPIEEWEQHKRVSMRYFEINNFYQVPAGSIRSKHLKNLFMAGRNISATTAAIASARVMGICLQTGYAAGCLAAAYAMQLPEESAINDIQNEQL